MNTMTFLPYGRHSIDDEDVAAVTEVLRGDRLTTGPKVKAFEEAFAEAVGARYAVACSSGTAALHLTALAADFGEGDAVVVPTLTFLATENCSRHVGAEGAWASMSGGEIFVRKVPSMRIVDLAEAIAPGVDNHIIGIRPGDKLHEVLFSEDETVEILDCGAHYIICPVYSPEIGSNHKTQGGNVLAERFRYTSETNSDWLDADALRELLPDSNG